jgi:multiple sugar transport system ATP-binding protein
MIYVTHDQVEAMTMGDRIVVMKDGLIQQVASPLEIYNNPANQFVAGFIGSPPMNFFTGTLSGAGNSVHFNEGTFAVALAEAQARKVADRIGQEIVCGIRPEDISESTDGTGIGAVVEIVEPMGAETFVFLNTGKSHFIARMGASHGATVAQIVSVEFNMAKARFFDPKTGATVA